MNKSQLIIVLLAIASLSAFAYGYTIFDDPRMVDGKLDFNETTIGETILIAQSLIIAFGSLIYAVKLAYSSRRWGWLIAVVMIWPLSFIYLYKHYKTT